MTAGRRLFYVCQEFPVLTQTFTAGEVAGLSEEGLAPEVVSCRRPSRGPAAGEAMYLPSPFAPASLGAVARAGRRRSAAFARCLGVVAAARYRDDAGRCWLRGFAQVAWGAVLAERAAGPSRPHFHAQFVDSASTVAYVAAALSGGTFSFTNHTAYNPYALIPKLRAAAVVLSISEFDRRMLLSMGRGAGAGRIRVALQGIDTARFDNPRAAPDPGGAARILSVGALREKKGHHVLLEALATLRAGGLSIRATVVGDGPERPRLEAARARLGLDRVVEFAGAEAPDGVRRRLAEADVFVLACVRAANGDVDGIPVSLMEAMAASVPVVSTRISGIPELVADGVDGLLARPGDAGDLARAIRWVLASPAESRAMALRGREKVRRRHERRECVRTVAAALREAMA